MLFNVDKNGNTIPLDLDNFNIPVVANFEKVSYEQFKKDLINSSIGCRYEDKENIIKEIYDNIKLPKRGTVQSAGYDFFAPFSFIPNNTEGIVIPTGIRCLIVPGWVLKLYPRSGQGFKYGTHLYNTVGVIDGDYYNADNEGHIMVKISVKEKLVDTFKQGVAFCQGIFVPYGITVNDNVTDIRTGGLGSTSKK